MTRKFILPHLMARCPHQKKVPFLLFMALVVCLSSLGSSGCRSGHQPAPSGFASVEIRGNTPGQIRDVAIEIFEKNGYQTSVSDLTKITFEKQAAAFDNVAHGDWTSAAWIRVKTSIVPLGEAIFRLQADAYVVRDRGKTIFEEEITLGHLRRRPFQKLLDEIAARLKGQLSESKG